MSSPTDHPLSSGTEAPAPVLCERDGGVATVTFNRPDAMNALDTPTKTALLAILQELAADPGVRCVVLTGSGRAFCVGQDLREHITLLSARDESLWRTVPEHYNPIVELIATALRYTPFAVAGFIFITSSISDRKFSWSFSVANDALPSGA